MNFYDDDDDDDDGIVNPEYLPVFRKGREIFDVVQQIADLIPEDIEHLQLVKSEMLSDASMLFVKVAGEEAAGLYDLRMENAAIIRKAARDLMVQQHSLEGFAVIQ